MSHGPDFDMGMNLFIHISALTLFGAVFLFEELIDTGVMLLVLRRSRR